MQSEDNIIKPLQYNFKLLESGILTNKTKYSIYNYPCKESLFLLSVNCGSKDELVVDGKTIKTINGLAHLIEHLLFTFNKSVDNLPFNITRYNGVYNALTGYNITSYYFCVNDSKFLFNLDLFFDIFKNLSDHLTDKTIESEIISIQHEKNKNYQNDLNNIYDILKNESKNILINHDSTGSIKSLKIDNILSFVKLFFKTFYKPENFRISIILGKESEKTNKISEIKERLVKFSAFYTNKYIEDKIKIENFNFSFDTDKVNNFLKSKLFESGKIINYQSQDLEEKNNKVFIFFVLPVLDYKFVLFFNWMFNRKDKKSLSELLKSKFNVYNFHFNTLDNFIYQRIFIFSFDIHKNNTKDIDLVYSYIQSYFIYLKKINKLEITSIINYYEVYEDLLMSYSREFKIFDLQTTVDIIYNNLNNDFFCYNELLNNYKKSNFETDEIKKILELFDLNNMCIVQSFYNQFIKTEKIIDNKINYNISDFSIRQKETDIKNYYSILPSDTEKTKDLIYVLEKDKKKCLNIENSMKIINKPFNYQTFKKIDFYYKTIETECFNICSLVVIDLDYYENSEFNKKLVNDLLIFENLTDKIKKKYHFLIPTGLYFFCSFVKSKIIIYFDCLNNYYLQILSDIFDYIRSSTNRDIKDMKINNSKYLISNIKKQITGLINKYDLFTSYAHDQYFYKFNFDYYKILDYIDSVDVLDEIETLNISKIKLFTNFNSNCNLDNENFKTLLFQYLGIQEFIISIDNTKQDQDNLLSSFISLFSSENKKIIFDFLINFDKRIIGVYNLKTNKTDEIINFDKIGDFKTYEILKQQKPNFNFSSIKTQNNIVYLNIELISPFKIDKTKPDNDNEKNFRDLFYLGVIKNIISTNFFKVFRTQKGYSYIVKSIRNDYENNNIIHRSLSFVIAIEKKKEFYNIDFILRYYDEVKQFFINSLKTLDIINLTLQKSLFMQKLLFSVNNPIQQMEKDYIIFNSFGKNINLSDSEKYIKDISIENIKEYYKDLAINQPFNLFIY